MEDLIASKQQTPLYFWVDPPCIMPWPCIIPPPIIPGPIPPPQDFIMVLVQLSFPIRSWQFFSMSALHSAIGLAEFKQTAILW